MDQIFDILDTIFDEKGLSRIIIGYLEMPVIISITSSNLSSLDLPYSLDLLENRDNNILIREEYISGRYRITNIIPEISCYKIIENTSLILISQADLGISMINADDFSLVINPIDFGQHVWIREIKTAKLSGDKIILSLYGDKILSANPGIKNINKYKRNSTKGKFKITYSNQAVCQLVDNNNQVIHQTIDDIDIVY